MQSMAEVYTADMREELKSGNRSILSRKLQELMQERLEKKRTDHAVSEPARLLRVCLLQGMRSCD